jgi:hypothetical protein
MPNDSPCAFPLVRHPQALEIPRSAFAIKVHKLIEHDRRFKIVSPNSGWRGHEGAEFVRDRVWKGSA